MYSRTVNDHIFLRMLSYISVNDTKIYDRNTEPGIRRIFPYTVAYDLGCLTWVEVMINMILFRETLFKLHRLSEAKNLIETARREAGQSEREIETVKW